MKVLIIGSGGREHALANAFAKSAQVTELIVAPGNPGIAIEHRCAPLKSNFEILSWCLENHPDIVFVGPEQPLSEGLADDLRENGIKCIGPSKAAARIETSKIFAKELMQKHGIPTAAYFKTDNYQIAKAYLAANKQYPIVLKADGLAAGKGVIIVQDKDAALHALDTLMPPHSETPKSGVVIEEFLLGWEVSLFAFTDGYDFQSTLFSQDHKQLFDHDLGPNTGGMGAFCPVPEAEPYREEIEDKIIRVVLAALREEGCPFQGVLYCGLMITAQGAKVIEFNCRFGDPETQALLPLLKTDLVDVCRAILDNDVKNLSLEWIDQSTVCVVLASRGYPGIYQSGFPITLNWKAMPICFGGVDSGGEKLITKGGRVLSAIGTGSSLFEAREAAYKAADAIFFEGKTLRKDIGLRKNKL
ncbi:MAG: phosphoribosylamine--glycine ligase [Candidatus Cloacimonadaceae bacterium]|nr:phosphoribosylamine--glycine ligase [Candidatus Cloacimonadaceae bacterium]MDP3114112.1 phosphoribosylamine--glycine ligase [Candidatus Cloacimonadaceae bacterium]